MFRLLLMDSVVWCVLFGVCDFMDVVVVVVLSKPCSLCKYLCVVCVFSCFSVFICSLLVSYAFLVTCFCVCLLSLLCVFLNVV